MTKDETDALGKRVRRYAKVSSTLVKTGVGVSVERLKGGDSSATAALLRGALGELKGPLMKLAQILGTIPDLVPKEMEKAFAELQADAPPMGPLFVKRRMSAELGADWEKRFSSFDLKAAAAASLGQVHKAVALDGRALACKLQYPDMASVVEADIRQMKLFLGLYERLDKSVLTSDVQAELADRLREELDYVREAKAIKLFNLMLQDEEGVRIPSVNPDLSTQRLLTMDWLYGRRFADVAENASEETRKILSRRFFRAWYRPFYEAAILHGDPHLGNYTVQDDTTLNLLDFGCIRLFDPTLVEGALMLFKSVETNDTDLAVQAYEQWGFKNPSRDLVQTLSLWARFVYAPLLDGRERLIEETNTGVYGRETARKIHDELRKIGGVTVPRAFVFMDRAAVGFGSVFLRLRAKMSWRRLFDEVSGGFNIEAVTKRQDHLLKASGIISDCCAKALHRSK